MQENFIIYNEEYVLIKDILKNLKNNTRAEIVFITDSEGHCIASTGEMEDSHLLSSPESILVGSEMIRVFKLDNVAGNYIKPENLVFLKLDVQGYKGKIVSAKYIPELQNRHLHLMFIRNLYCPYTDIMSPYHHGQSVNCHLYGQ